MVDSDATIYSFSRFRLDAAERLLFDGETSVARATEAV